MSTHLTIEDLEKYMDTSDLSEEYLLWMEGINQHLDECERCQKLLDKAIEIEYVCEEENFADMLKLAEREEEIRRNMVACKLMQMCQSDETQDAAKVIMIEAIKQLQMNAVHSYVLQLSAMPRYATVARGEEEYALKSEGGMEITTENGVLQLKTAESDKQKKFTAVLDRKENSPMVCEASWDEETQKWIAKFDMADVPDQFEVHIIDVADVPDQFEEYIIE